MCGIAGFIGDGNRADLLAMTNALVHRGPDGEGFFVDESQAIFLGHRRLVILDPAGGRQPMWNEDGRIGVVFNGEIYNHLELRRELEGRGHVFRTDHSDTEALVHGYEEWGEKLPGRLNGMFAFAIIDRVRGRLFLARDRFGEKPLYYAHRNNLFAFASELTALARHPGIAARPSLPALQKLFAYGYIPAPNAYYEGTRKLPGGHFLSFDLRSGALAVKAYWRFRIEPDEALGERDEPRLVEELRHLLGQAVKRRLISDVPLGLFLSGGIDSGSVLALAARAGPAGQLKTFTIGFSEPSFDETPFAREMARAVGSDHRERRLDLDSARGLIPAVLGRLDEPLADPSILPTYLLSAFTRESVTVALSGDGGDELFAGYDPFRALAPASLYARMVPRGLHRGLRRLADLLPISTRNMSFDYKLRRALGGLSYRPALWNPVWMAPVQPEMIGELLETSARPEEIYAEAVALWDDATPGKHDIDRTLEFYSCLYLQDNILAKVDRAAMMNSLESRAVFLDNDVVEFCRRLPHTFKLRGGQRKYLLKKAMAGYLPRSILRRPKKGFGIPLASWLRQLPAEPMPHAAGVNGEVLERWWSEHRAGKADHRLALWAALSLPGAQSWHTAPAFQEAR